MIPEPAAEPALPAMPSHRRALTKSSIASLLVTGTEFVILAVLVHPLQVPHWVGYLSVQFLANLATFLLYKYWAFEAGAFGSARRQYLKQLVIFGGSLGLNTGISSLLSYRVGLEPVLSFALSNVLVYLCWNYPGNRYWVFRR
jgi:putative flippase GtrA